MERKGAEKKEQGTSYVFYMKLEIHIELNPEVGSHTPLSALEQVQKYLF